MKSKALFVASLLLITASVCADDVIIYRCTDAHGAWTLQNKPCAPGMKQETRVMKDDLPTTPALQPLPPAPAPVPDVSLPATKPVEDSVPDSAGSPTPTLPSPNASNRLPPPVLFECTTYNRDRYISEDPTPPPRCVPLQTVGLDGNRDTGAGQSCEMKRDQCARVPDGALCDAWKKRLGETEVAWRFGRPQNTETNKAEYGRVQRIVNQSACAQ
jgi:hypothetical protein